MVHGLFIMKIITTIWENGVYIITNLQCRPINMYQLVIHDIILQNKLYTTKLATLSKIHFLYLLLSIAICDLSVARWLQFTNRIGSWFQNFNRVRKSICH